MKTKTLLLCGILGAGALTTFAGCSLFAPADVAQAPAVPLADTHWRLIQLGDQMVDNPPGARDIHFVLQAQNTTVSGDSGCNRMFGRYALNGASIKFDQMGGTRMFCQDRMEVEQKFLAMFATVARWKITGQTLQLLDASGSAVGTFAATVATG